MARKESVVYLLCLSRPLSHARHYLGSSLNVQRRLKEHMSGRGSKFTQAVVKAGIELRLATTWEGQRFEERQRKHARNAARWCPFCRDEFLARDRARRKAKRDAARQKCDTGTIQLPIAA